MKYILLSLVSLFLMASGPQETNNKKFEVLVRGQNIIQNVVLKSEDATQKTFYSFNRSDYFCIRTIVRAYVGKSYLDFWVYVTMGHTQETRPILPREYLDLRITGGTVVVLDDPPVGASVYHGQGLPMKHFRYNLITQSLDKPESVVLIQKQDTIAPWFTPSMPHPWIRDYVRALYDVRRKDDKTYDNFEASRYTPRFPGKTGLQDQFGTYILKPEIYAGMVWMDPWRKQLYQEGCRPGHHLHPDGRRVTDMEYPKLVGGAPAFHGLAGKSWINYTDPRNTWRDVPHITPKWSGWDSQHWSLNALCQTYILTKDPGLEMLLEDLVETWMFCNPVVEKGTTHHIPGSARGKGRVIEAGCSLAWALKDKRYRYLRIRDRVKKLLQLQINMWHDERNSGKTGLYVRNNELSIWQHALWVKGLAAGYTLVANDNPAMRKDLTDMGLYITKWILKNFVWWGNKWGIPYTVDINGKYNSTSPSLTLSRWCLPALELLSQADPGMLSSEDIKKLGYIFNQFIPGPIPPSGGWSPDNYKWRML